MTPAVPPCCIKEDSSMRRRFSLWRLLRSAAALTVLSRPAAVQTVFNVTDNAS
jgi:hypothetical protein